ncbi:PKD domain-containing protein [Fulvivirga ulvae]|uniref:PKD domain-containing protein n=1 Tax=Fulvivirga ulvae TaxID=2904245 RepID=UPI001F1FE7ED|nr:PKD domain-containing protein [Fulvivirga ulvae]UII33368.1 PKD domain-containing protein [Fulvivirga ulvae]
MNIKFLLTSVFFFIECVALFSQPSANYTLPSLVCLEENVAIQNLSSDATSYQWDFCEGDLTNSLVFESVGSISAMATPTDMDIEYHDGNWIGIATSRSNNSVFRINFGSEINDKIFTIQDLGNINGLLSGPDPIKLIYDGAEWFAFIINANNSSLIRVRFGNSLLNEPIAEVLLTGIGGNVVGGLDIAKDGGSYIAVVTNSSLNKLTLVSLGSDLTINPSPSDVITTTGSSIGTGLDDILLKKYNGNWFAFTGSISDSRVRRYDFGGSLFSDALPTRITTTLSSTQFRGIEIGIDAGEYYGIVITNFGELYRLNFGSDLENLSPTVTPLASTPLYNRQFHLELIKSNSFWNIISMNAVDETLVYATFQNDCELNQYSSEDESPYSIKYQNAGTFYVSLTAYNDSGENDMSLQTITVSSQAAPDIDFTSQNLCLTSSINFSSINTSGNINSYNWNFGDGNSSTSANPNHTYASVGDYTVTLEVISSDGCENFTQKDITIFPEPAPAFNLPSGAICTNDTYLFENTTPGNYDGNISYEWFVNGVSVATTEDLSYEFPTGGAKEIKLVATIPGCSVESVQNISNVSVGPVAQFTVNDDCVGKALQFNNTSTGDITSTHWDFGNGFTSNLENPLFQYAAPGTYDVTLTLTNSAGCQTSKVLEVNVYELPDVQFTNDLSCEGTPTAFTDETTVGDANITSWSWSFDDPSSESNTSTDRNPIHTFTTDGAFDVKLVAQTTNGCKDSVQQVVNVKPAPVADFEYDKLCINESVQFMDASEPVPGEDITTWSWDLGGVFSAEQNPVTTFQFAIDYSIGLTVTSENLCTATTYRTISIRPAPSVTFGVEQACDNAEAHFFDTTDPLGDPVTSRSWNLANQATSEDSSAYHAFNQAGSYDVGLTIITENGCDYSVTQSIQINEAPTAAFEPSVTFGAPPLDVEFTNKSVGANNFQWIFEEGSTSDNVNPTYTFTEESPYDVRLVASDENGCNDTITHRINVLDPNLDIVLTAINRNPADETEVILTVGNNGTVTIDSFKASVDLGNQATVEKVISQTLNPRVSSGAPVQSVNINLDFSIDPQSLDYLCVTLIPLFDGLEESDITNNTKCINLDDNQTVILAPYPNPASDQLRIQIISNDQNPATIQLYNAKADLVKEIEINRLLVGMNNILINAADIDKGLYVLKVSVAGKTAMYKVIVEN